MARNPLCSIPGLAVALALAACGTSEPAPQATPAATPTVPSPSPSASAAPTPATVEYVAQGNEPFWRVETHVDRVVYSSPEQPDGEDLEATVSQANGWTRFEARMDGSSLLLEVRKGPCSDDMSGFAFSHEARLTRADGAWRGCARLASEPQPHE